MKTEKSEIFSITTAGIGSANSISEMTVAQKSSVGIDRELKPIDTGFKFISIIIYNGTPILYNYARVNVPVLH
jgi:hypothetical protein